MFRKCVLVFATGLGVLLAACAVPGQTRITGPSTSPTATSSTAGAETSTSTDSASDAVHESISPDDTLKLVAQARDRAAEDNAPGFSTPGIDYKRGTVQADEADVNLRKSWLDELQQAFASDERTPWVGVRRDCKVTQLPHVVIDLAVVKLWRIGTNGSAGRAQPLEYFFPGVSDDNDSYACPYGQDGEKNAVQMKVRRLMQMTRTIHYVLDPAWTKTDGHYVKHASGGFTYSFDKATGELTVGIHTEGSNIYKNWNAFIDQLAI